MAVKFWESVTPRRSILLEKKGLTFAIKDEQFLYFINWLTLSAIEW
jgi:hypothetical protein